MKLEAGGVRRCLVQIPILWMETNAEDQGTEVVCLLLHTCL